MAGRDLSRYRIMASYVLTLKGTLCHLVSSGGTEWQNDTKWSIYNT